MPERILKLLALGLANAGVYHYAYLAYLYPVFEYAGFRYESTSFAYIIWTYAITALPLIVTRKSSSPSSFGCALIYAISYTPIQLTLSFTWHEKNLELLGLQALLALSMASLFIASRTVSFKAYHAQTNAHFFFNNNRLTYTIHSLSIAGSILIIFEFHSVMTFVSFAEVYDLRTAARELQASTVTHYLIMWMTYCFGPFYIARALIGGRKHDWVAGLTIFILIYTATGSKLALMTPAFIFAMKHIDNGRQEFLVRLLLIIVVFVGAAVTLLPNEGLIRWVNAIFLMRVFGSNGWTAAAYYEFFSEHGHTFYTHIGPINAVFGTYPYGDRSLGQEIAKFYFNSDEANFNAGFWASDGFAALGILGVPIITAGMLIYLKTLNSVANYLPHQFINLWLLGFWMALMNAPFTTALVSCGGLLSITLLATVKPRSAGAKRCA